MAKGIIRQRLEKSIVRAHDRVRQGHLEHVGMHVRADRDAIVEGLARRHAHHQQLAFDFAGAGGGVAPQLAAAQDHAATGLPDAAANPAEAPATRVPAGDRLPRERGGTDAQARQARRRVFENAHGHLAQARHLEGQADATDAPAAKGELMAKADALRAELAVKLGPAYENELQGRMVDNYAPDLERVVADWCARRRIPATRDDAGRPTGAFGQLVAEARFAAYDTLRRYTATNRTPVYKLVLGEAKKHLYRRGRQALGDGAYALPVEVNEDLARMERLQQAHMAQHGEPMSDARLAEAMGVSPEKVADLHAIAGQFIAASLDQAAGDGPSLGEAIPGPYGDPADLAEHDELVEHVHQALGGLDPVARATVAAAYNMPLDPGTLSDLLRERQFPLLEQALARTFGEGKDADMWAEDAIASTAWLEGTPAADRKAIALKVIEAGGSAAAMLTAPERGAATDRPVVSVSELHRRLGLKAANSGSVLRTAMAQLSRNPVLATYRDTMAKGILALDTWAELGPHGAIVADAVRAGEDFVDFVVKSLAAAPPEGLPAPFTGIIASITERDHTGELRVRGDRAAEAAVLVAALVPGGYDGELHGDSDGRALHVGVAQGGEGRPEVPAAG